MGSEGRTHGATDNTARLMAAAMFILALILGFFSISNHSSPTQAVVPQAVVPQAVVPQAVVPNGR